MQAIVLSSQPSITKKSTDPAFELFLCVNDPRQISTQMPNDRCLSSPPQCVHFKFISYSSQIFLVIHVSLAIVQYYNFYRKPHASLLQYEFIWPVESLSLTLLIKWITQPFLCLSSWDEAQNYCGHLFLCVCGYWFEVGKKFW